MNNTLHFLACLAALVVSPAWALDIADFGGWPDGSDTTPAWNAALAAAQTGPDRTIRFGQGSYFFDDFPDPITADGITITGIGQWTTHLVRTFSTAPFENFIELQGRGSLISRLEIATAPGTTGGRGLAIIATNFTAPGGKHKIEDVRISGVLVDGVHQGTWAVPLFLRGDQRTINPAGMRVVHLSNVAVFDGTMWAAVLWGCISCNWFGGGAWQGSGTTQGIAVGGAGGQKNRIDADIDWRASVIWFGQMRGPGR